MMFNIASTLYLTIFFGLYDALVAQQRYLRLDTRCLHRARPSKKVGGIDTHSSKCGFKLNLVGKVLQYL